MDYKKIELIYEWENTSYNTYYKWYLVTHLKGYQVSEIGSNGYNNTRYFALKKDAKNYLNNELNTHKRFFNLK